MTNLFISAAWWAAVASNQMCTTNIPQATRGFSVDAERIEELRLQSGGRMSEIAECVAVVTNVVKADNERGCATCDMLERAAKSGQMPLIYHLPHTAESYKPATERTETTTIIERRTLRFRWSGEWRELMTARVMGEPTVRRWVLRAQWEEAK